MVILFSGRKSDTEKEIIEILTGYGGNYISDKKVYGSDGAFTVISEYKKTELVIKKGIAVIIDDTDRFERQIFPKGIIGICESSNKQALEIFEKNRIPIISCGMNSKNTVTISSLNNKNLLLALQRTIIGLNENETEPGEFKIKLKKDYKPFSVMASAAVLLLYGILPCEF